MDHLWNATLPLIFASLNCLTFAFVIGNAWLVVPPSIPSGRSSRAHFHTAAIAAAEYAVLESVFVRICTILPSWFPPQLLVWNGLLSAYMAYHLTHMTRLCILAWRMRDPDWLKRVSKTPLATSQHPVLFPFVLHTAVTNAAMQVSGLLVRSTANSTRSNGHWMAVLDVITVLSFLFSHFADYWLWKDLHGTVSIFKAIRAREILVCASLLAFLHFVRVGTRCLLGLSISVPLGLAHWQAYSDETSVKIVLKQLDGTAHLGWSLLCFATAILLLTVGRRQTSTTDASDLQDKSSDLAHAQLPYLEKNT